MTWEDDSRKSGSGRRERDWVRKIPGRWGSEKVGWRDSDWVRGVLRGEKSREER